MLSTIVQIPFFFYIGEFPFLERITSAKGPCNNKQKGTAITGRGATIMFLSLQATPLQYRTKPPAIAVPVCNNGQHDISTTVIEVRFSITSATSWCPLLKMATAVTHIDVMWHIIKNDDCRNTHWHHVAVIEDQNYNNSQGDVIVTVTAVHYRLNQFCLFIRFPATNSNIIQQWKTKFIRDNIFHIATITT